MAFTRSATGCFACKSKHKKCDETKPHCLRCQKSRIECPGYTYVEHPNKPKRRPRTLPGPRSRAGQSRATAHESLENAEEPDSQLRNPLPPNSDPVTSGITYGVPGASEIKNAEATDILNPLASVSSFSGPPQHVSTDLNPSDRLESTSQIPSLTYHTRALALQ
ncbi:hypothetical protein B0J17DRAFT_711290 [Rhizoctonia solani]|nr:hypothetical protein B0J17DRAFT_711290 [Rhizoctonia solani]